jgi:MraZ protein
VGESGANWRSSGDFLLFSGDSYLNVDDKGRLAIPARYREGLQDSCASQLVITVDPGSRERCLLLYPQDAWHAVVDQLKAVPNTDPQANTFRRLFVGRSVQLEMDRQGRILLPVKHREYAGLGSQVVLVGQINKFEIWDAALWSSRCDQWAEELDLGAMAEDSPLRGLTY